jgi:hypothetical protein
LWHILHKCKKIIPDYLILNVNYLNNQLSQQPTSIAIWDAQPQMLDAHASVVAIDKGQACP